MRTISQAPKPQRPVRAVSTVAGHSVPEQEEAGQHQHAAVEDEEHVAEDGVAGHVHVAQEGEQIAGGVVRSREYRPGRSSGHLRRRKPGRRRRGTRRRGRRRKGRRPRTVRRRRSRSSSRRQRRTPPRVAECPATGERSARGRFAFESARTFWPRRRAACPASPRQRPISGAKRKRRRRMLIGAQPRDRSGPAGGASLRWPGPAAPPPWRPRRSSSRKRSQSSIRSMDCSMTSSRSRLFVDISWSATNQPGSSKRRLARSSISS